MADRDPNPGPSTPADGGASDPTPGWWAGLSPRVRGVLVGVAGVAATAVGLVAPNTNLGNGSLDLTIINGCGLEGTGTQGQWDWTADPLKNRYTFPSGEDLDGSATLTSMSAAKDGTTFNQTRSAEVEGYITYVKVGGVESCNCKSNDPQYMDTHIYLGPTANAPHNQCIIVEVTPRLRELMAQQGVDWSTQTLVSTLTGHHVQVTGWMFDDSEHADASEVDNPGGKGNWRASVWEIHPVTGIQILDASTTGPSGGSRRSPTVVPASKSGSSSNLSQSTIVPTRSMRRHHETETQQTSHP